MKRRICFLLIIAVIAVAGVSLLSAGPHDEEQAFRENVQEILDRYIQGAYPKDYADMDATLILSMPDENAGICNVIGRVLCTEKNELIANAVITVKKHGSRYRSGFRYHRRGRMLPDSRSAGRFL